MLYTVLGSEGFIGRAMVKSLLAKGHQVNQPPRNSSPKQLVDACNGHVLYCIGLTADFRKRPFETVEAHVSLLKMILSEGDFDSLTYLSSTRVYMGGLSGDEDSPILVQPLDPGYLYNLSKLMGESLCHAAHHRMRPVRVVRVANVLGNDLASENFVFALIREATDNGVICLQSNLYAAKDYVALADVISMLELIATNGRQACYNLASGIQISNDAVIKLIVKFTGASVEVVANAPCDSFPKINIDRLKKEFNFQPRYPLDEVAEVFSSGLLIKGPRGSD